MIEFFILIVGITLGYNISPPPPKPVDGLSPKQCSILCDKVESYDELRKRCLCQK